MAYWLFRIVYGVEPTDSKIPKKSIVRNRDPRDRGNSFERFLPHTKPHNIDEFQVVSVGEILSHVTHTYCSILELNSRSN